MSLPTSAIRTFCDGLLLTHLYSHTAKRKESTETTIAMAMNVLSVYDIVLPPMLIMHTKKSGSTPEARVCQRIRQARMRLDIESINVFYILITNMER